MLKKNITLAALSDDADGVVALVALSGGGSQAFVFDGALVNRFAELSPVAAVILDSAGNDSGVNFVVTGTDTNDQPLVEPIAGGNIAAVTTTGEFKTVTGITADGNTAAAIIIGRTGDTNSIVESVTLSGGGLQSFVLDGADVTREGVFGAGQILKCTCTGDETARTFTIVGVDVDEVVIGEDITGVSGTTVDSILNYKSVTSITSDGNTTSTVSWGTLKSDLGYSATMDVHHRRGMSIDDTLWLNVVSGTLAVTVEITDEMNAGVFDNSRAIDGLWLAQGSFTAQATDKVAKNTLGCFGYRLRYTAYTSGSVDLTVLTTSD